MRSTRKHILKQTITYVTIGFVSTFVVASVCAILTHRHQPGYFSWGRMFPQSLSIENAAYFDVLESRWFGAKCFVYRDHPIYPKGSKPINETPSLYSGIRTPWWALEVSRTLDNQIDQWDELESKFDPQGFPSNDADYMLARYGFPFLCFEVQTTALKAIDPSRTIRQSSIINGAMCKPIHPGDLGGECTPPTPPQQHLAIYIPYSPIWSGLAVNSIFYALVFFSLITTKRALTHSRRMQKGKCPICKYDLVFDNSLGCPECGWRKSEISNQ